MFEQMRYEWNREEFEYYVRYFNSAVLCRDDELILDCARSAIKCGEKLQNIEEKLKLNNTSTKQLLEPIKDNYNNLMNRQIVFKFKK